MPSDPYENTDLPDEYLCEIGRIVVAWNKLESHLLHTLVYAVIDQKSSYERAVAAFVHTSFPQKLDILEAMLRPVESDFAELYIAKVQGNLREAQKARNTALHQFWYVDKGIVQRADVQARGQVKWKSQPITIQELKNAVIAIEKAFDHLLFVSVPLSFKFRPHEGQ